MAWPRIPPPYGVYVSTVTFFDDNGDIDYRSNSTHTKRLLDSGVTGLVVHGNNEVSDRLTREDRSAMIAQIKQASAQRGRQVTVIAGCGAASIGRSLSYISDAREAGAEYALIPPPSNLSKATSKPEIKSFYSKIATHSSLPILIYDTSESASVVGLDCGLVIEIFNSNNVNVVGIVSADDNLTKLQHLSSVLPSSKFVSITARTSFVLSILVADSNGMVSTLANITPKLHCEILRLLQSGELRQAQDLQAQLSDVARSLSSLGVLGIKAALQIHFGYGHSKGRARFPIAEAGSHVAEKLRTIVELERKLFSESKQQQTRL